MACIRGCLHYIPVSNYYIITRTVSMSAMWRAKEALNEIKVKNPYFEKYAEKIAKLQKTSPDEFISRVDKVVHPSKEGKSQSRIYSELLHPKQPRKGQEVDEIPYKKLTDIMKLDLIEDKSAEEISKIWIEYHKTKDVLAATLTSSQFEALMQRAKQYPVFLLPLPRSEGFEFFMLQFAANAVHFTSLLAYQVHAENAPECLTLVHYTEFKEKGLVLMRGEYDVNVLTGQEAQCLANELQMFYYKSDESKIKLLETFNKKPDEFKHMDLIKEVENIQLV